MAATEDNRRAAPGKPTAILDHVSIAPGTAGGVSITLTMSVVLDDTTALEMVLRAIGTIARSRGVGSAP